jgi:hypothetical protein
MATIHMLDEFESTMKIVILSIQKMGFVYLPMEWGGMKAEKWLARLLWIVLAIVFVPAWLWPKRW